MNGAATVALRKVQRQVRCPVPSREDAVESRRCLARCAREVAACGRIGRVERVERRAADQSIPSRQQIKRRFIKRETAERGIALQFRRQMRRTCAAQKSLMR